MDKVYVLMSTYNGDKYLKEQLESILDQKNINVSIFIRDDGSTDNTEMIIKSFCDNHNNIHYFSGENIGYGKSFMELIKNVPNDAEYYAFSDQDDVWKLDKLISAIQAIREISEPALYCALPEYVDQNLVPLEGY